MTYWLTEEIAFQEMSMTISENIIYEAVMENHASTSVSEAVLPLTVLLLTVLLLDGIIILLRVGSGGGNKAP